MYLKCNTLPNLVFLLPYSLPLLLAQYLFQEASLSVYKLFTENTVA